MSLQMLVFEEENKMFLDENPKGLITSPLPYVFI